MQRRYALAVALALTVVTVFSIIAVGTRSTLFRRDGSNNEELAVPVAPPVMVEAPAPPPQSAPEPIVITEYVYRDVSVPSSGGARPSAQQAAADAPPAQPPAAAQPTRAAAPPTPPPAPTVGAPTSPQPSPAPTQAPAQPPAAPTAPPAPSGPSELEFTGTVAAINGDVVTFSHDGTSTAVRVTKELDELEVGTRAQVHAIKTQSGYVAKEIEVKDGN